mmetsp:Transcript_6185/g.9479  ORF Transcript_6185/g.9479 Transcript_6185/m.9479 type:complete len:116 (+) Transcript_6185:531-878(+)
MEIKLNDIVHVPISGNGQISTCERTSISNKHCRAIHINMWRSHNFTKLVDISKRDYAFNVHEGITIEDDLGHKFQVWVANAHKFKSGAQQLAHRHLDLRVSKHSGNVAGILSECL